MIPRTFPSTYASNGQQQMVVYFLTSVAGLARWSDYIPVKLVQGGPENSYSGTIDVAVIPSLTAQTQAWKEYIPVYLDDAGTDAWTVNAVGYIPYNYALFTDASMQLDLTNGGELDPRVTFTRTSNATVTDSTGTLVYAPHNLLTFSESFDNAAWASVNSTISANSTTAPNGSTTADSLIEDAQNLSHRRQQTPAVISAGVAHTFSVYAKEIPGSQKRFFGLSLSSTASAATWATVRWDLSAGTMVFQNTSSGFTIVSDSITPEGNGWYRCSITAIIGSNTDLVVVAYLMNSATTISPGTRGASTYQGDGTSGIFIWGAQLNVGSLQPYYPTTRKNLLGFTQEFDNAGWTKSNSSISATKVTAPDESLTGQKLVENTANSTHLLSLNSNVVTNTPYNLSIYAKAGERSFFRFQSFNAIGDAENAVFDLLSGAVVSQSGTASAQILDVGGGWYRCSFTLINNTNSTSTLSVQIFQNASTGTYTGDGTSGIFIWGAQLSDSASLDPYVYNPGAAPASTAYFGPRFDYDPVTLAPKGLLIEEQRTNLLFPSESFSVNTGVTVTNNAVSAPSGFTTATSVVEDTATGLHAIQSTAATLSAVATTISVYAKPAGRNWIAIRCQAVTRAFFNISSGAVGVVDASSTASITNAGNGWYRCSVTFTPTAGAANVFVRMATADNVDSYTGDGTSGISMWGMQAEAGAFATSYIPTTTAAATRAADVAVMTGANFSNWYNAVEGTVYFESQTAQGSSAYPYSLFGVDTFNRIFANYNTLNRMNSGIRIAGTFDASVNTPSDSAPINTFGKGATAYKVDDFGFSWNGAAALTDTSTALPTILALYIGSNGGLATNFLNGHIRRIAAFPRRLANAELTALTS
jgi:hypothetical protein